MNPSARAIAAQVRRGERSAVDVVNAALLHIQRLEPALHAWVTLDARGALDTARWIDARVAAGESVGPLAGVPVGIKDIIDVAGLPTTGCSPLFQDSVADRDAHCVAALRAAGAIVLGKTTCAELAGNDPPVTVNPWNPAHTPGGSSSGSAVAVATGMCAVALGSQTGGSTLRPAAYTGVVGLKPTYARLSLDGVMSFAPSLDTLGILASSVQDAELVLRVLADDRLEADNPGGWRADSGALPTIGVVRQFFCDGATQEVRDHVELTLDAFSRAGAAIREVALPASFDEHEAARPAISGAELAARYVDLFTRQPAAFGPLISLQIEAGLAVSAVRYLQAQHSRTLFAAQANGLPGDWDVLLMPTTPAAAPADLTTTGSPVFQAMWTSAGMPAISIPSGTDAVGLPLGMQLVARTQADHTLLGVARWCETVLSL